MKSTEPPIIVEQLFESKRQAVWKSITELKQMRQWFFENIPSFTTKVGFKVAFNVAAGERNFMHLWRLTDVVPERKIVYEWQYQEYKGKAKVTFELSDVGEGCRLRLVNEVEEEFPQSVPEFTRTSCLGGWEYFIKQRLKKHLEE